MDRIRYEVELEREINKTINSCYPQSWDEELITHELLKSLGNFFNSNSFSDNLHRETKIKFIAYKLRGKTETEYGDIAFLTSIRFDNGIEFKGVANFEAKKRLRNDFNYQKESRKDQFKIISNSKPYSQILLYDYEPISQNIKPILYFDEWNGFYRDNSRQLVSQCVCFPLYMVADGIAVNRNHNCISRTMSEQLCRRIFYGIDLHLDKKSIEDITNFDSKNHPKFVVDIQVTHGNTSITEDNIDRRNLTDIYERLR